MAIVNGIAGILKAIINGIARYVTSLQKKKKKTSRKKQNRVLIREVVFTVSLTLLFLA